MTEVIQHLYRRTASYLKLKTPFTIWPYIDRETCLVADLADIEKTPVIYNTLTRQIYQDGGWIDQPLDLRGTLLIYRKQEDAVLPGAALLQKGEQ